MVITFLDPECPVANAYIPVLIELYSKYASHGFKFLGVYTDLSLSEAALLRHVSEYQIPFGLVRDDKQELSAYIHATYSAEVAVIDQQGQLIYRGRIDNRFSVDGLSRPAATQHDLASMLDLLVKGHPGPFVEKPGYGCALPSAKSP